MRAPRPLKEEKMFKESVDIPSDVLNSEFVGSVLDSNVGGDMKNDALPIDPNGKWKLFLRENEELACMGLVTKNRGIFAKKRMLILAKSFSGYRLPYVDTVTMAKKGEIPWTKNLWAELKGDSVFCIHVPDRTYWLRSEDETMSAKMWVDRIQKIQNETGKN